MIQAHGENEGDISKVSIEEIERQICEVLRSFQVIELAYLYGSFLTGDAFNDIDVALYCPADDGPYEGVKFALQIGKELERHITPRHRFDVRLLLQSPLDFQYTVIKTGKLIFVKDEIQRIAYEAQLLSDYLDYRGTSEWLDREFLRRIEGV